MWLSQTKAVFFAIFMDDDHREESNKNCIFAKIKLKSTTFIQSNPQ